MSPGCCGVDFGMGSLWDAHRCMPLPLPATGFTSLSNQLHPGQIMLFLVRNMQHAHPAAAEAPPCSRHGVTQTLCLPPPQNTLYSVWDSLLESFDVYKVSAPVHAADPSHWAWPHAWLCHHALGPALTAHSSLSLSPHLTSSSQVETIGDSYVAACGLFSRDPVTGAKRLGGYDPDHAKRMLAFAKAMLWSSQSVKTPLGEPVQVRVGECRVRCGRPGGLELGQECIWQILKATSSGVPAACVSLPAPSVMPYLCLPPALLMPIYYCSALCLGTLEAAAR